MTNYSARLSRRNPKGNNIKGGRRRKWRQPAVQPDSFWGVENFLPTAPNQWVYTWQGLDCPVFEVAETDGEITATLDGGEITATFQGVPHSEVKCWLDDQILYLMKLQADAADPTSSDYIPFLGEPMVVCGQEIGPEIGF